MKPLFNSTGGAKLIWLLLPPVALLSLGLMVQRKHLAQQAPTGLSVSPVTADYSDGQVAQLLDIKLWKFKVTSRPNQRLTGRLELRETGKASKILGTIERLQFPANGQTEDELSVSIYPIGGSLSEADKIKWQVGTTGITQNNTISNPFKNAATYGFSTPPTAGYPAPGGAGEMYLMDANLQHPPELRDKLGWGVRKTRLFLIVKVEPQPDK